MNVSGISLNRLFVWRWLHRQDHIPRWQSMLSMLVHTHLGTRRKQLQVVSQLLLDAMQNREPDTRRFMATFGLPDLYLQINGVSVLEDPSLVDGLLKLIQTLHLLPSGRARTVQEDALIQMGEVLKLSQVLAGNTSDLRVLGEALPLLHHNELLRPQELLQSNQLFFRACQVYYKHRLSALNLEADPISAVLGLARELLEKQLQEKPAVVGCLDDGVVVITT